LPQRESQCSQRAAAHPVDAVDRAPALGKLARPVKCLENVRGIAGLPA
jgi:hypothetical protein